jgi:hypothetical protein
MKLIFYIILVYENNIFKLGRIIGLDQNYDYYLYMEGIWGPTALARPYISIFLGFVPNGLSTVELIKV